MKRIKKIRAAVIGVGNIGQHHARVYKELTGVKLLGVCDLNKKRVLEIAKRYHAKPFTDYRQLIKEGLKLDAISVAVSTKDHQKVACFCLKNKVNVLLEKPIASTLEEAEKIIRTARQNQVKLMIGHVERFNPAVIKLKKIIEQGKLGKITSLIARRIGVFPPAIDKTNVFLDLAIHDIDIFNYLLNETPQKIYKHSDKFHARRQEDAGEIFLVYKNAAAFVQTSWITPVKIRTLAVTGTGGYAELDYIAQSLILHQAKIKKNYTTFSDFLRFSRPETLKIKIKKEEPLKREIRSFLKCIRSNSEPLVSGEEALKNLAICLQ